MDPNQMPPGMPPPGMMPPPMGGEGVPPVGPEGMPPPPMPEAPPMDLSSAPAPSPSKGDEQKKQVLQKLISNLLGKPGRSFNELANGIKMAMTAYKSYAKEIDTLNGVNPEGSSVSPMSVPPAGGSSSEIQKILNSIQQKKASSTDGAGGPGVQYQPPTIVPLTPQPIPNNQNSFIAGNPQTSTFNRPAPVNQFGVFGY